MFLHRQAHEKHLEQEIILHECYKVPVGNEFAIGKLFIFEYTVTKIITRAQFIFLFLIDE